VKSPPQPAGALRSAEPRPAAPPISSEQLLHGATTLAIDHAGQRYLLRVTRENKLILTK
jgi:hemin uptake protein HemP